MDENIKFLGLFNKECSDPKFYCRCHGLFLSEKDVEMKKCYHKPTKDMISEMVCPYIRTYEEYISEQNTRNETYRRFEGNKKSKGYSVAQPAYKSVVKRMLKEQRETNG